MTRAPFLSVLALVVGACGGGEAPKTATPPAAPPQAAQAPAASQPTTPRPPRTPTGAFEVVGVDVGTSLGADGKIAQPSDRVPRGETIHAVVATEGRAQNVAVTARWTSAHPTVQGARALIGNETQTISPEGPAFTAFKITKAGGWPAGQYEVEISAHGGVLMVKRFAVE